jgi:16S rRNA processing protein RimM
MSQKFIEMGTCKRPHGIKGGFQFHLYNTEDSSLKKGTTVKLVPLTPNSSLSKEGELHKIKSISMANKTICYLEDITDRNIVEAMIPFTIFLDRADFKDLNDGEVYLSDIEGFDVLNENNEKVGTVITYYDHGASDILVVEKVTGKRVELPFVDAFFPEINIEEKYLVMIDPEIV